MMAPIAAPQIKESGSATTGRMGGSFFETTFTDGAKNKSQPTKVKIAGQTSQNPKSVMYPKPGPFT